MYEELVEQIMSNPYKDMAYTIFNHMDDDGYIQLLKNNDIDFDVDDFTYCIIDIGEDDRNMIRNRNNDIIRLYKGFKNYVETILQTDEIPLLTIQIIPSVGNVFAVKHKDYVFPSDTEEDFE